MLSRSGHLFLGGPAEGLLQQISPPVRLLLVVVLTGITAFSQHPLLPAIMLSLALIVAVISYLDLFSILKHVMVPLVILAVPSWTIAALFFDLHWSLAAFGILRVASTITVAMVIIHSLGLINVAPALRRLGFPPELCSTLRMMISQATIFSDVSAEMQLAQSARILNHKPSGKIRQLTGRQMAILFARMLQRSRELTMAIDAREVVAGYATANSSPGVSAGAPPVKPAPSVVPVSPPLELTPLFQLRCVTYEFSPGEPALDDVAMSIQAGTSTAILGANAAGKSTLLHLLAGLLTPTRGEVHWNGQPIAAGILARDSALRLNFRRRTAIVFQDPDTQWLCENVLGEIEFGPRQIWSADEAVARAEQVMVTMGVSHLASRPPYALSGGEKRRVALAAALAMDPETLLLDEPTMGLDPATTDFLIDCLHEFLAVPGKTLIFSSHDLPVVAEIAKNIIVLTPCHRLARSGQAAEILQDTALLRQMNLARRRSLHGLS